MARKLDRPISESSKGFNRFYNWVASGFEKLNANPETGTNQSASNSFDAHNGEVVQNRRTDETLMEILKRKEEEEILISESGLCFRIAQLSTELLLMLFAASLLLVAAIVIVSTKTPAIMQSYEVVPKFLFVLCVITAVASLIHWVWVKVSSPFLTKSGIVEQSLLLPGSMLNQALAKSSRDKESAEQANLVAHTSGEGDSIKARTSSIRDQFQRSQLQRPRQALYRPLNQLSHACESGSRQVSHATIDEEGCSVTLFT